MVNVGLCEVGAWANRWSSVCLISKRLLYVPGPVALEVLIAVMPELWLLSGPPLRLQVVVLVFLVDGDEHGRVMPVEARAESAHIRLLAVRTVVVVFLLGPMTCKRAILDLWQVRYGTI